MKQLKNKLYSAIKILPSQIDYGKFYRNKNKTINIFNCTQNKSLYESNISVVQINYMK